MADSRTLLAHLKSHLKMTEESWALEKDTEQRGADGNPSEARGQGQERRQVQGGGVGSDPPQDAHTSRTSRFRPHGGDTELHC